MRFFNTCGSWFNCLYCIIYLLNLVSECILPMSIYCFSIRTAQETQYFNCVNKPKIIVIGYLGDAVKICSNVTYVLIKAW